MGKTVRGYVPPAPASRFTLRRTAIVAIWNAPATFSITNVLPLGTVPKLQWRNPNQAVG